ncbi:unnamed protein product [Sphenostylis stenocarpa]|uniref:Uncharacterized protein n=1 Tax=Sphenostylis stenocarpa TaxID=92480 RepID=A0AA86RUB3_9FABA|nr:unnamed protein product [Sphenostylis stenocarpa]
MLSDQSYPKCNPIQHELITAAPEHNFSKINSDNCLLLVSSPRTVFNSAERNSVWACGEPREAPAIRPLEFIGYSGVELQLVVAARGVQAGAEGVRLRRPQKMVEICDRVLVDVQGIRPEDPLFLIELQLIVAARGTFHRALLPFGSKKFRISGTMDSVVDSLNNAYQDFVAAAANVLEAKENAGSIKTTATDTALENFKQKWELFRVACDQAEEFVESVKQRIGSECLVDEATRPVAGKPGQATMTGLPPISAVRLEQMSKAVRWLVIELQHGSGTSSASSALSPPSAAFDARFSEDATQ